MLVAGERRVESPRSLLRAPATPTLTTSPLPRPLAQRWTAKFSSNVEDTVSEIEEYLLQSPLVTSTGRIVVATDDCTLVLLPDPSSLTPGAAWTISGLGSKYKWTAPPGPDPLSECSMAGLAMDNFNSIFMLDGRNKILYKVEYEFLGFTGNPLVWSTSFFTFPDKFEQDVSMVFIPGPDQFTAGTLWVPTEKSMLGQTGVAIAVNPADGTFSFIPIPDSDCAANDFGSAGLSSQNVALLGHEDCGMYILNATSTPPAYVYKTYPLWGPLLFDYGQHSHPIFDTGSNNLFFVDWATSMLQRQRLCCINTLNYQECPNWPSSGCLRIPEEGTEEWAEGTAYDRWEWLAGALYGNYIYLAGSGTFQNKVIISGPGDLESALFVWDWTTGVMVSSWRTTGDLFNSPPLVVQGNTNDVRVFVLSSMGTLYAFSGGVGVSAGPLWTSPDVTPIPADDLPATTYSYLSVTVSGTLLVTASAGGADWADEKVYHAVVNGIYPPPVAAVPQGMSSGATAGVVICVLGIVGASAGFAYYKVPAFGHVVDKVSAGAMAHASRLSSSVRTEVSRRVAGAGGFASVPGERSGLLSRGSGPAPAAPPAFSGMSGQSYAMTEL